ncbi:MAG TPA: glycosyltransferase family 4 protein [Vicinamibacterales bacterium]|nr:glycosyltransferase family 4 protein [Vicinamibacterales bacterium]HOQ60875.1 glycosyltransferase family 4 protein [Vicinamibacterales bacterium]HPK70620.1 glycosyltransferase family 4 protein [Vicinamibacterales bacterium]
MSRRHVVVMLTTSYPRFPGDAIATFMEPIALGLAARGHQVHIVLPWHPRLARGPAEGGVRFHPFRYAPHPSLNVFGYAAALRADVELRAAAYAAAPLALAASFRAARRVAREAGATILHGHWLVPSGAVAAAAAGRLPVVISLHGSDVFVAERHAVARRAARAALGRADALTACSDDLRDRAIAIGADPARSETIPYGVDVERFRPDAARRAETRRAMGADADDPVLFTAGRLVRKKGFGDLIDAVGLLATRWPRLRLVIGGGGDLDAELRERARRLGVADRVEFAGVLAQDEVAARLAAADVAVVPSVHDEAGNVDGLPNTVMEALASGTPLVATRVGGIPSVVAHGRTGWLVPERDASALANALDRLLADPASRAGLGAAARAEALASHTWARVAERFEAVYDRAACRAEERRGTV